MKTNLSKRVFLVLAFINICITNYAQDTIRIHRNWIKIGGDIGLSYIDPNDINSLFDYIYNAKGIEIQDEILKGIHFGYSGDVYISIIPFKFFELRPQIEYSNYPYTTIVDKQSDINVKILNLKPGISANFIFGKVRIGGELFKYQSIIGWKDDFYHFDETWKGNTQGYNIFIGFNSKSSRHFGWSSTIIYEHAIIDELKNSRYQVINIAENNKNFTLDLSGFRYKLGFYFAF